MANVALWTYHDALEHLNDYVGTGAPTADVLRDGRRCVQASYRELANAHSWSYYWKLGRINTVAPYSTGTFEYDHHLGVYERMVLLTGGVFPSWAAFGTFQVGSTSYTVAELKDDTTLTLAIASNPGADVAAGTTYTLYRDTYPLPCDYRFSYTPHTPSNFGGLVYVHPREWLAERSLVPSTGQPRIFTITGDDNLMGALALVLYPAPDAVYATDFLYQRQGRPLTVDDYHEGTVSVALNGTTVTGSGTAWSGKHVGSVFRFAADGVDLPTGLAGGNPFLYERTVLAVASATELTVDLAVPEALAAVKYRISDPLDLEYQAMLTPFLRGCEKQMATVRIMKDKPNAVALYDRAVLDAKAHDARMASMRGVGWDRGDPWRLKYMPLGADD